MSDNLEISVDEWVSGEKREIDGNVAENDVEKYENMLHLNKQILSQLLHLKVDLTLALQKCERKLAAIEKNLQRHTVGERKVLICTAGIPYFKDRHYFFAPKNEDELLKESRNELQMVNLPKTSDWSMEDKDILVNAVRAEKDKQQEGGLAQAVNNEEIKRARYDGPAIEKELDWMKISSLNYEQPHSPLDCRVIWNVFLHHDINKSRWTVKEDIKLKEIAKTCKYQNWEKISSRLGTQRTAYQCFVRYNTTKKLLKVQNYNWSSKEDKILLKLVEIYRIGDFIPWGELTNWMPNRTKQQIYYRWTYSLAPYLSKGRFTRTEDRILLDGVNKFGKNFHKISAVLMPHRSTVQLHYRYETLILNEVEDWNRWTMEEDAKLLELFHDIGPDWSAIAKQFPRKKNRTQLRHRCTALKKYIKKGITLFDLHCNEIPEKREMDSDRSDKETVKRDNDDDNDDSWIEQKLIEYFRSKFRKENVYSRESLERNVTNLYHTLQQLDTVLLISDEDIDKKLTGENRRLAFALKDHIRRKKDDEKQIAAVVDRYRRRMFACSNDKEIPEEACSHFIPPLPFDIQQQKSKRSKEDTCTIDYGLNRNNNFMLEIPLVFDTPDLVVSYIGKENWELQKFITLYGAEDDPKSNVTVSSLHSKEHASPKRINAWMTQNKSQDSIKRNASGRFLSQDATNYDSRISFTYYCTGPKQGARIIDASHATLSSFRNLTHLKRLSEKYNLNNLFLVRLNQFYKTFAVLETRLEQLFKYPIGMSLIDLPEDGSNSFSFIDPDEDQSVSNVNVRSKRLQRKE